MERNQKAYNKLIQNVRPVLVRRFGAARAEQILQDAGPVYGRFLEETPSIGGKANVMNQSMDMALPFFAVYEASGRVLCKADLDEMLDILMVRRFRKASRWIDMNQYGLSMTLVGCPLADFAKEHGYLDILPQMCAADVTAAAAVHARLIRHHTVAQGYETCDY